MGGSKTPVMTISLLLPAAYCPAFLKSTPYDRGNCGLGRGTVHIGDTLGCYGFR